MAFLNKKSPEALAGGPGIFLDKRRFFQTFCRGFFQTLYKPLTALIISKFGIFSNLEFIKGN